MNPIQALDILDRAAGLARLTRDDHLQAARAVQTLREFIAAKTPPGGNEREYPRLKEFIPRATTETKDGTPASCRPTGGK